jgi:hypothetical protein
VAKIQQRCQISIFYPRELDQVSGFRYRVSGIEQFLAQKIPAEPGFLFFILQMPSNNFTSPTPDT